MKRTAEPPTLLERLGREVRRRRELAGRTLRDVAARAGLSPRFLSMVEAGRGNISLSRLERLAHALDAAVVEVLGESGSSPRVRPVALLGLRGAGKSTLGARAAEACGRRFVELDRLVEDAAGMPLGEIFAVHGEPYYRKLEREALDRLLAGDAAFVLATGGGIVAAPETFELLRRACVTVWLRAAPREHWERVTGQGDQRPMASRPDAMAELQAILAERQPLYRKSDFAIDTSRLGIEAGSKALARIVEAEAGGGAARPAVRRPARRR
jgi:XRE family transcriptional regulator, aerobic/anaerobic benzoate catabolism transcriptional regulator